MASDGVGPVRRGHMKLRQRIRAAEMQAEVNRLAVGGQVEAPGMARPCTKNSDAVPFIDPASVKGRLPTAGPVGG
jgi:hypothetical protein